MRYTFFAVLLLMTFSGYAQSQTLLVEAEGFNEHGGWSLDQQGLATMGSPYLLAHGLGVPVADATTTVQFPETGTYRVYVRTKDWVARWDASGAPGKFKLLVDGDPMDTVFGTTGAEWFWHYGGEVTIDRGEVDLALHDLTGFEGRCDAILFTTDADYTPPNNLDTLETMRKELLGLPDEPADAGEFDLVVIGGGVAGTCAAVSAAREGVDVALIQNRPVLGGNSSSEVRVWIGGGIMIQPFPRLGSIVKEFGPRPPFCPGDDEFYEQHDQRKLDIVQAEETLSLFLNTHAFAVEKDGDSITAVIGKSMKDGSEMRFRGDMFADCTGDGTIGYLAGADSEMLREGHMGSSNLWRVVDTGEVSPFPRCPWALDLTDKPFPKELNRLGKWFWESGFSHDPVMTDEYVRDWNFRAMYGAWDCLKNHDGKYPDHKLKWAAFIAGKRESRRLLGDVVLTKEDVVGGRKYPDACVPSTWSIDLHVPNPKYDDAFQGDEFISVARFTNFQKPYWVPYRCFYSRNVENLFMAGRDISVTHEALGTVRVMATGGMIGEVVGKAAAICKENDSMPRGVYEEHLDAFMELLKGPPSEAEKFAENAGKNVALNADIDTSGSRDAKKGPPSMINDGKWETRSNSKRWLSKAGVPNWVEFSWNQPQVLSGLRIVSGYYHGGVVDAAISDFVLQQYVDDKWEDIPGTRTNGNSQTDWFTEFEPVQTDRVRLLITETNIDISRIWEIGIYSKTGDQ